MKGFKSFARETVIEMDRHMNVIVGPNGSGKSNVTDAICFVLGRLSIKSIRAAKSSHLIFSGNKHFKPAVIGYVEIIFDNSDKTFSLENNEIIIRRTVKKNGQGVYRINREVKTRQEVLELLSQAGIDPHGFNIVLQGEIEKFVKMPADDRRKVIEEVAGISIYEIRKEKSLKELDKTSEKLRQVNAILRERTNYLKNLENEREQALRFKKLESAIKRCRASIINRNIQERKKELNEVLRKLESKIKDNEKIDNIIKGIRNEIDGFNEKIENISRIIQKSSGLEQDSLSNEITNLKQEYAGMRARKENYENQLKELERRKKNLQETIISSEEEIKRMIKEKPKDYKKDLEVKKKLLDDYEESKRKYYLLRSNYASLNTNIEEKKRQIAALKNDSGYLLNKIEESEKDIKIKENIDKQKKKLAELRNNIESNKLKISENEKSFINNEKSLAVFSQKIKEAEKIKKDVEKLDICPLCKTKITSEHIKHLVDNSDKEVENSKKEIKELESEISKLKTDINKLVIENDIKNKEISEREISIVKIKTISEKKQELKNNENKIMMLNKELSDMEEKRKIMEKKLSNIKITDEDYEKLKLDVNELMRNEERNLGAEITAKQRELERIKVVIKQLIRDDEEIREELNEIESVIDEKDELIIEKEMQAENLKKKYQKMYEEKNKLQDETRKLESRLINQQNEKRISESDINNLNIDKAQINARIDTLNDDFNEYKDVEIINISIDKLKERLENSERALSVIGSVNMRALEVYDGIKEEYDRIKEKVNQLDSEKENITKVIEQIDRKKKKTFTNTLKCINELFSRNFSQLSEKGIVSLEPQDKKEIFNSGLSIIVKVGNGKYFDVTSLSGGEQTLVALSLIFAIQELNPYCFYIFDEIDAALDRRNSEKLAHLLRKHMKKGQYLIITHNDSIISESTNILYGVSMQEGVSKVLSLEI